MESKKLEEVKTRASEAKGPFPGGKRVGSWGKKESKRKKKETHPAQWVGLKALIRGLGVVESKSETENQSNVRLGLFSFLV